MHQSEYQLLNPAIGTVDLENVIYDYCSKRIFHVCIKQ